LFLYLAPIRGITDCIFRTIYAGHFQGFDAAIAPFISTVKGRTVKRSHIKDVWPENNRKMAVVPQIIGNNPVDFVILSHTLFDLGYAKVNWNIGCPFPQVTKKKRGSGLLPHPEMIRAFLDYVVPRIPNKLSIKTRLGFAAKDEMQKWLPVLNDFPIAEIIVHPRTGKQLYNGAVDLEGFEQAFMASRNPVIYNGDITGRESFETLRRRFPALTTWMIGRGALANPALPEILTGKGKSTVDLYLRIKAFHNELLETYDGIFDNQGNTVDKMKGIWFYLNGSFKDGTAILKKIQKVNKMDRYLETIDAVFSQSLI
jgi:tRNA-dihydrouridine synthase B